eukprot:4979610-Prorocentrum_lima.AAC.1
MTAASELRAPAIPQRIVEQGMTKKRRRASSTSTVANTAPNITNTTALSRELPRETEKDGRAQQSRT